MKWMNPVAQSVLDAGVRYIISAVCVIYERIIESREKKMITKVSEKQTK